MAQSHYHRGTLASVITLEAADHVAVVETVHDLAKLTIHGPAMVATTILARQEARGIAEARLDGTHHMEED
jgi:hypothetical protein